MPCGSPSGSEGKASASNAGDRGSIPGLGRSPGERSGNPLQYSCLQTPTDRGAWRATVHGFARSWTRLSDFTFTFIVARGILVPWWGIKLMPPEVESWNLAHQRSPWFNFFWSSKIKYQGWEGTLYTILFVVCMFDIFSKKHFFFF